MEVNLKDKIIRSERTPWQFVERNYRKGYMDRDFYVGTGRYRHFASGADELGVVRYGYLIGDIKDEKDFS